MSSLGNHLMEKLESVQYAAALAVTGMWRGTSRERLYNELGWEPLSLTLSHLGGGFHPPTVFLATSWNDPEIS